jgi:hypothetical protein
MNKPSLLGVLFLPSILVGVICVAGRGLAAVLLSPVLVLLPVTQVIVVLTNFAVIFPVAMIFAAVFWVGIPWGTLRRATFRDEKARVMTAFSVGILHAVFMPWSLKSLMWYA